MTELKFEQANERELQRMRCEEGYQFSVYDGGFHRLYGEDAWKFLCCGRDMLYSSISMADDRLLLAKAQHGNRAILLYVDRDYYELTMRDEFGNHHLLGWQMASLFKGLAMEDLEYMMAQYLFHNPSEIQHLRQVCLPKPTLEFWEEGEDPPAVQAYESLMLDNLI